MNTGTDEIEIDEEDKGVPSLLDEADMKDIDEVLTEEASTGNFEGEIFLSTDGKHTVRVKANSKEGRKSALEWAKLVYEGIKSRYGTKQQLNMETYNKEEDLGVCPKCGAKNARSQKGKIYCSAKCWLPKT